MFGLGCLVASGRSPRGSPRRDGVSHLPPWHISTSSSHRFSLGQWVQLPPRSRPWNGQERDPRANGPEKQPAKNGLCSCTRVIQDTTRRKHSHTYGFNLRRSTPCLRRLLLHFWRILPLRQVLYVDKKSGYDPKKWAEAGRKAFVEGHKSKSIFMI